MHAPKPPPVRAGIRRVVAVGVTSFGLAVPAGAGAETITVNSTGDAAAEDGSCTLREAIDSARFDAESGDASGGAPECVAGSGADTIDFAIVPDGAGDHVISPGSVLPDVSASTTIDGLVNDPDPIEIDGSGAGAGSVPGLSVLGGVNTIRGLSVYGFSGHGISVSSSVGPHTIEDSFIGTDSQGTAGIGNDLNGIDNSGSDALTITDNVISGNGVGASGSGIRISGSGTDGTVIKGNKIGTNSAGTAALPNDGSGINFFFGGSNQVVGGPGAEANVISGNNGNGINFSAPTASDSTGNTIEGNLIGTDAAGTAAIPNASDGLFLNRRFKNSTVTDNLISGNGSQGIAVTDSVAADPPTGNNFTANLIGVGADGTTPIGNGAEGIRLEDGSNANTIGGTAPNDGNVIANNGDGEFNLDDGVAVVDAATVDNPIIGNSIHSNGTQSPDLGIDLGNDGVTANDADDPDAGPNGFQNFPVLSSALIGNSTIISGSLDSLPSTDFRLEFFAGDQGDGEGRTFLGSADVSTDGNGDVAFTETVTASATAGDAVTATATRLDGVDPTDTSEFSASVTAVPDDQIVVNSTADTTADDGACTLREAITAAASDTASGATDGECVAGDGGGDEIGFAIIPDAAGDHVIAPASALPSVTGTTTIDGAALDPDPIEIDGSGTAGVSGLTLASGTNTVRGLSVYGFDLRGVSMGNLADTVEDSFIGTDSAGTPSIGNGTDGIGTTSGATITGNVISGNGTTSSHHGVVIVGTNIDGVVVQGNRIGTNPAGTAKLANAGSGVLLDSPGTGHMIGGSGAGEGNQISGNDGAGVWATGAPIAGAANAIEGNLIGVAADGTSPLGNGGEGVSLADGATGNTIGGTATGEGNVIAHNGDAATGSDDGVAVDGAATAENPILGNSIHSNGADAGDLGIDLDNDGVTPNDPDDPDAGPNGLQNFPVLSSAVTGNSTTVAGTMDSLPSTAYRLEFFANPAPDDSGNGEGRTFLGAATASTDVNGDASFSATVAGTATVGDAVTATATRLDSGQPRDTSEFSGAVTAQAPPPPPVVPSAPPSNSFSFGKLKPNKKKGIAILFVNVPGPGQLGLAGKGVKPFGIAGTAAQTAIAVSGGRAKLVVKPHKKGKAARKLRKRLKNKGKAKLKVRVTYVPAGGTANTRATKVKLVQKRKRKPRR